MCIPLTFSCQSKSMQCIQSSEERVIILDRNQPLTMPSGFSYLWLLLYFSINLNLYDTCANINYILSELHDLFIFPEMNN